MTSIILKGGAPHNYVPETAWFSSPRLKFLSLRLKVLSLRLKFLSLRLTMKVLTLHSLSVFGGGGELRRVDAPSTWGSRSVVPLEVTASVQANRLSSLHSYDFYVSGDFKISLLIL